MQCIWFFIVVFTIWMLLKTHCSPSGFTLVLLIKFGASILRHCSILTIRCKIYDPYTDVSSRSVNMWMLSLKVSCTNLELVCISVLICVRTYIKLLYLMWTIWRAWKWKIIQIVILWAVTVSISSLTHLSVRCTSKLLMHTQSFPAKCLIKGYVYSLVPIEWYTCLLAPSLQRFTWSGYTSFPEKSKTVSHRRQLWSVWLFSCCWTNTSKRCKQCNMSWLY